MYVVICRADAAPDGTPGVYVAATRTLFGSAEFAARHAAGVSPSREPRIVTPAEYLLECVEGWRTQP